MDSSSLMKTPFFVFYAARSGSTFLANELMSRSSVTLFPETNFAPTLISLLSRSSITHDAQLKQVSKILQQDSKFTDWNLPKEVVLEALKNKMPLTAADAIRVICQQYLRQQGAMPSRFGFKKGSYLRHFESLKNTFPTAQFVGLIRDGRAVYNSQRKSLYSRTKQPFERCPTRCGKAWKEATKLIREVERRYPNSTLIVKYEELVQETEAVIKEVLRFLEVRYESSSQTRKLTYNIATRYGQLHENVERPPLAHRIAAWRDELAPDEVRQFETVAKKQLVSEGYGLVEKRKHRWLGWCLGMREAGRNHERC